ARLARLDLARVLLGQSPLAMQPRNTPRHLPPQGKLPEDLARRGSQVGAQQRLGGTLALWTANEHAPNGNGREAPVQPDGCLQDELHLTLPLAPPARNGQRRSLGCWSIAPVLQRRRPAADQR